MSRETDDIKLVKACIARDGKAQKALYEGYYGYGLSVCLRYCNDDGDVQDILQEGFIKVFASLNTYQPDRPLKFWIRTILVNTAIDHYRKQKKHWQNQDIETAFSLGEEASAYSQMGQEEILLAVRQLPTQYRLVFNLYVMEGFSHKEIANKLGIGESTSRSHLTAANAKLRVALKKNELIAGEVNS